MAAAADLKFSESHEWHALQGDVATIGLTRYAVDALTDVTFVQGKPVGTKVAAGGAIGEVESVKTTSDVYSAVAGEIMEVNSAVVEDPSLLNKDPMANWLVKVKVSDQSGMSKLMDAKTYESKYHA
ncbi:glycine cleavage system protein GcvH [soil metagenome]